jgi:arabinofuranosyltransferase
VHTIPPVAEASRATTFDNGGGPRPGSRAAEPDPLHAEPPATSRRVLTLALLLVPAVVILCCGWQRRWTADDGFINLRVVRQLLEGHGPVFNAGQRVETGTSPAWVALLAFLDVVTPFRLEWIAAITGLLSTAGAVVLAVFGTRRALRTIGVTGVFLPLGALAYVSVPPAWDFATSGLETGLALLWLGAGWWLLCGRIAAHTTPDRPVRVPWYVPVVLGLGPLVRPDFLVFSVGFVLALALLSPRAEARRIVLLAAVAPVVAELARMAYFASLVPNTAMAKEASLSNWSQGARYLVDFVGSYALVLPVLVLGALWWLEVRRRSGRATSRFVVLSAVVAGTGVVHALYVVRVGGDFMHARLLLPAFFVVLLPASVVAVRGAARMAAGVLVVWAIAAIFVLRPPYSRAALHAGPKGAVEALAGSTGIGDERLFYTRHSSSSHPVTIDDYLQHDPWAQDGLALRRQVAREDAPVLVLQGLHHATVVPLRAGASTRPVASGENLGLYGYAAGTTVDVVDDHGLADVVAGHLRLGTRGRPGHEKALPDVWTFARYAARDAPRPERMTSTQVAAARRALACGGLERLLDSTDGAWSIGDVPTNLVEAVRSFQFRFDQDPVVAAREVCGT